LQLNNDITRDIIIIIIIIITISISLMLLFHYLTPLHLNFILHF